MRIERHKINVWQSGNLAIWAESANHPRLRQYCWQLHMRYSGEFKDLIKLIRNKNLIMEFVPDDTVVVEDINNKKIHKLLRMIGADLLSTKWIRVNLCCHIWRLK